MKALKILIAMIIFLVMITGAAHAEVIIEMTMGTTQTSGGASIFYVSAIAGTHTTNIKVNDTVIGGLGTKAGYFSIQINDITLPSGSSGDNSATTYEIIQERSLFNDSRHWSGVEEESIVSDTLGGTSLYTVRVSTRWTSNTRYGIKTGATSIETATMRLIFK